MSKDYLSYQVDQVVTEQLKGILTAKDLANMVITLKIEFKNKKETEEEKETREREEAYHERKSKYADFRLNWGKDANNRSRRIGRGELDNDGIERERQEVYETFFPGEKEKDFLKK